MAKQKIYRKRGFSGSSKNEDSDENRRGRKNRRKQVEEEVLPSPDSSNLGDSSEEVSEEEVVIHREPSMYDNLLKTLASGSESIANANRRRQRAEEGKSDSDEDDDSKFLSESMEDEDEGEDEEEEEEEEEDENGSGDDSPSSALEEGDAEGSNLLGSTEHSEDDESDDGDEASEVDEEEILKTDDQSTGKEAASTSSFNDHLGYKISNEEVEILSKKKWKYKWEVSGPAISNCKWMATREFLAEDGDENSSYGLKLKLFDHWVEKYKASGGSDFHSSKQRSFFSLCNSYQDILHHNKKPFYLKGREEDSSIMDAYIMHSLNHVFKTRDLVSKNDTKLAKLQESTKEANLNSDSFLDRGFTRPKVLILLPMASIAFRVVKRLIELTPSAHKVTVEHLGRFSEEFGTGGSNDQEDEEGSLKSQKTSKPSDFQALFGGNNNDHFMIGIKLTRKSIRLYGDFYSSDVIVASPLGLITKIGEAEAEKEKDVDYLSSIEVLIIDHADVIAMQNWSHVNTVVEQLNRIPSKQHGTDIMRVRHWHLDGQAQFYRQSIILGSHVNPEINAVFNNNCLNYRGKVKLLCEHKGVLPKVLLNVGQVYERFDAKGIVDVDDARLEYFSKKVFPKIKEESIQGGVLLFISSYFEFVRVRNFLKSQDASFCLLGEYTKQSDISRARVWFFQGSRKIMLYTERAHFYHRYKIRGIKKLIMYSLPERKEFYPEILNMLEGGSNEDMSCRVLFSRFDQLRLERIVGSATAKRMITSDKGVFTFQ